MVEEKRLKRSFYLASTLEVARELLGKLFIRVERGKRMAGKIVETEAYLGPQDRASHTFGGKKTSRNQIVFMEGGRIYIYLIYGIYWQLNITTGSQEEPQCVLVRAIEPVEGIKLMQSRRDTTINNLTNGPGKLCQALGLDKSFYGEDLVTSKRVWLEHGYKKIDPSCVVAAKRIGIDYAREWAKKPWRFYIKDNPFVSRK